MIADNMIAFRFLAPAHWLPTTFYVLIFQTLRYSHSVFGVCASVPHACVCVNRSFVSYKWCRLLALLYYNEIQNKSLVEASPWNMKFDHDAGCFCFLVWFLSLLFLLCRSDWPKRFSKKEIQHGNWECYIEKLNQIHTHSAQRSAHTNRNVTHKWWSLAAVIFTCPSSSPLCSV